jgi:hypothetical protein
VEKDVVFGDIPMRVAYELDDDAVLVQSVHMLEAGNPCGTDIAPMLNVCVMVVPGFPPVPVLEVLFQELTKCSSSTMN